MKRMIETTVKQFEQQLIHLSDQIWSYAETDFTEYQSSTLLANFLEEHGFKIERNVADLPTAFIASFGSGSPEIGILGEYDALPQLSQQKGLTQALPIVHNGNGHGCGHNLLGTAGIGAVLALKQLLLEGQIQGTIHYYGCPAEEGGDGKVFMVKAGAFEHLDAAISWHPGTENSVMSKRFLANVRVAYRFSGKSAHAGGSPHLGRSALDGVEIMNIAANFLREHVVPEARIHYAITNAGGISPNVVQHEAEVEYLLRGPSNDVVYDLFERVNRMAEGAALMTGTSVEFEILAGTSNVLLNAPLEKIMYDCMQQLEPITYDKEDIAFAEAIRDSFRDEERKNTTPIQSGIEPYRFDQGYMFASSDVGDVSWQVPTVQCTTTCFAADTALHTWQVVSQGATAIAHKGMLFAANAMALTASTMMQNEDILIAAQEAFRLERNNRPYRALIPDKRVTV